MYTRYISGGESRNGAALPCVSAPAPAPAPKESMLLYVHTEMHCAVYNRAITNIALRSISRIDRFIGSDSSQIAAVEQVAAV